MHCSGQWKLHGHLLRLVGVVQRVERMGRQDPSVYSAAGVVQAWCCQLGLWDAVGKQHRWEVARTSQPSC